MGTFVLKPLRTAASDEDDLLVNDDEELETATPASPETREESDDHGLGLGSDDYDQGGDDGESEAF